MGKSNNKEINNLFNKLGDDWTVTLTNSGHYKVHHKGGDTVIVSGSPGTGMRWLKNIQADIRRVERKYINATG